MKNEAVLCARRCGGDRSLLAARRARCGRSEACCRVGHGRNIRRVPDGEVPERSIGTVSKTVVLLVGTEGSNPSLSARRAFAGVRHEPSTPKKTAISAGKVVLDGSPSRAYIRITIVGWLAGPRFEYRNSIPNIS